MFANSSFISKLLGNELGVSSTGDWAVYWVFIHYCRVSMDELSEMDVIGHDVKWEVCTFKNCNIFAIISDFKIWTRLSRSSKGSYNVISLVDSWFLVEVSYCKTNPLPKYEIATLNIVVNLISCKFIKYVSVFWIHSKSEFHLFVEIKWVSSHHWSLPRYSIS